LLIGEFKSLTEIEDYDSNVIENKNVRLLIREDDKSNPVHTITIVESVFLI